MLRPYGRRRGIHRAQSARWGSGCSPRIPFGMTEARPWQVPSSGVRPQSCHNPSASSSSPPKGSPLARACSCGPPAAGRLYVAIHQTAGRGCQQSRMGFRIRPRQRHLLLIALSQEHQLQLMLRKKEARRHCCWGRSHKPVPGNIREGLTADWAEELRVFGARFGV